VIELEDARSQIHPSRIHQVSIVPEVSAIPRDLTEDRRVEHLSSYTELFTEESTRASNAWQLSRVNPLPQTKRQLEKARKVKQLQHEWKITEG